MSAKLLRRVRCTELLYKRCGFPFSFFFWPVSAPWLSDWTVDGMMRSAVASEGRLSRIRSNLTSPDVQSTAVALTQGLGLEAWVEFNILTQSGGYLR